MFKLNIKKYRHIRKMTQEELALKCGLTQQYMSMLEQGIIRHKSPTLRTIERISKALQVCPKDLINCSDGSSCVCGKRLNIKED